MYELFDKESSNALAWFDTLDEAVEFAAEHLTRAEFQHTVVGRTDAGYEIVLGGQELMDRVLALQPLTYLTSSDAIKFGRLAALLSAHNWYSPRDWPVFAPSSWRGGESGWRLVLDTGLVGNEVAEAQTQGTRANAIFEPWLGLPFTFDVPAIDHVVTPGDESSGDKERRAETKLAMTA